MKQIKTNKIFDYVNNHHLLFDAFNTLFIFILFLLLTVLYLKVKDVFVGNEIPGNLLLQYNNSALYYHGMILFLAFSASVIYLFTSFHRNKEDLEESYFFAFWVLFFGIIGGKGLHILLNLDFYARNINKIYSFFNTELSLLGGIILGFIFVIIYQKIKKVSPWRKLDQFSSALLIALFVGNWSSLFSQSYVGLPTNNIFKFYVSPFNRIIEYYNNSYFQPLFFYESMFCLALFIFLFIIQRTKRYVEGKSLVYFLGLYGAFKLLIGFIALEQRTLLVLTNTQLTGIYFIIFALIINLFIGGNDGKRKDASAGKTRRVTKGVSGGNNKKNRKNGPKNR